jgi:hypothetical protein
LFADRFERITPIPVISGLLNDTGIQTCANPDFSDLPCPVDNYPGQDGEQGRDALAMQGLIQKVGDGVAGFDFTKIDQNGFELPKSASDWSCVRDNHTGLLWEVKTSDQGLQDYRNTFTWYNPDSSENGGDAGTLNGGSCTGASCDTAGYISGINSQGLCGISEWRLPTRTELWSIMNLSSSAALDESFFPNVTSGSGTSFWSNTPVAGLSSLAYLVGFGSETRGDVGSSKSFAESVRLVAGRR